MTGSMHSVSHAAMGAQLALARPSQTVASALAALEGPLHVYYRHARVLPATGTIVQIRYFFFLFILLIILHFRPNASHVLSELGVQCVLLVRQTPAYSARLVEIIRFQHVFRPTVPVLQTFSTTIRRR